MANKKEAPEANTPTAPETPKGALEVVSHNKFEIVDNTDAAPVEEKPVESEETELVGGLVRIEYR